MTEPNPAREQAFEDWYMNVILGPNPDPAAVAHEAFCSGWEAAKEGRPDSAVAGPAAANGGQSVSPDAQSGSGAQGAAQEPVNLGEFARVDIMGHDQRTGYVTDGSLAGAACLDVRDRTGRLIAKIPPQSVYMYSPLLPPGTKQEQPALPVGAWGDYTEDDDYGEPPL